MYFYCTDVMYSVSVCKHRSPVQVPATTLSSLAASARDSATAGLGKSSGSNAFRDATRFINKWGLKWNIRHSWFRYSKDIEIPYLSPRAIVTHLLSKCPELLFGGAHSAGTVRKTLSEFWDGYRGYHGDHMVFTHHPDYLTNVIPMLWHGDEGRGVRKGNTTVCSLETPFGLDSWSADCYNTSNCCEPSSNDVWRRLNINLKYHSYLTKYLLFAMPKKLYKNNTAIQELAYIISQELRSLFFEGVFVDGRLWHVAIVGLKGDMAWFLKIAELDRCFTRLSSIPKPCCHECLAGGEGLPFEDISETPAWTRTLYLERPWTRPPSTGLTLIPFDGQQRAEMMLRRDIFHNSKVGVFQDYIGSSILLVAEFGYFSSNGRSRKSILQSLHGHFKLHCTATGKSPNLMGFTKTFFNVPTRKQFPWAKCKGSDAMLLMAWLVVMARSCLNRLLDEEHRSSLEGIIVGAKAGHAWLKKMYEHGLFWSRGCAAAINDLGKTFLRSYNFMAWLCLNKWSFPGYAMKPKLHMLKHTVFEIDALLKAGVYRIPSVLIACCESNEDFIGRISRLSRRAHQRRAAERVIDFYLTKAYALHKRYLKDPTVDAPKKRRRKTRVPAG